MSAQRKGGKRGGPGSRHAPFRLKLFVPWYKATVSINGSSVTGFLIQPSGTVSGIAVHGFLWLVFGSALLQFAVLAAHPER